MFWIKWGFVLCWLMTKLMLEHIFICICLWKTTNKMLFLCLFNSMFYDGKFPVSCWQCSPESGIFMGTFPVNLPRNEERGGSGIITFILKINFVVVSKYFWKRRLFYCTVKINCLHFLVSENCFLKHLFQGSLLCQHFFLGDKTFFVTMLLAQDAGVQQITDQCSGVCHLWYQWC